MAEGVRVKGRASVQVRVSGRRRLKERAGTRWSGKRRVNERTRVRLNEWEDESK